MIIEFQIENQIITRLDNQTVVGDSKNYLYARFIFTDDWNSVQKTAQFTRLPTAYQQATTYNVLIDDDNMCLVPYQVLQERGTVRLNVFGGDLITTKPVDFPVIASGLLPGELPDEPQPGYFQQVIDQATAELQSDLETVEQLTMDTAAEQAIITAAIGSRLYTENNFILDNEPLTASINKLDQAVKDNEEDASANLTAIGNRLYTENNFIADSEPVTTSIDKLDQAVKDNEEDVIANLTRINGLRIMPVAIPASQTKTITIDNTGHFFIQVRINALAAAVGAYMAHTYTTAADRWNITTLSAASNIVIDKSANTLTIQNTNATDGASAIIISLNGAGMVVT